VASCATLEELHHALAGKRANRDNPAFGSIAKRLQLAFGRRAEDRQHDSNVRYLDVERRAHARMQFTPPLNRTPMSPVAWGTLNPFKRGFETLLRRQRGWIEQQLPHEQDSCSADKPLPDNESMDAPDPRGYWQYWGNIRRAMLLALMLGQTALATYFMKSVLPYQGKTLLELVLLFFFALLFCWVSAGFWTAAAGFLVLVRGNDRYAISRTADDSIPIPADARTAIVMPICNEDAARVMAGLRATYESVVRSGDLAHFDFFVLSDSSDSEVRAAELGLWAELCNAVDGFGRIFYRHRKRRVKRKSGNIDDFCRRWGKNYRYMIVLDADSVMSGTCITKLVRLMEANPGAGIIQTSPVATGRETLYARIQQFSTRVYGPLFTAGLHYWQLGESHYWGHNAIIRMAPLMRHCVLSPLPGRGSLSGEILSHDFVEAALMRRAGWAVWIAYDIDGSYEEMPPNLLDELKRDRRWCHGNLMNARLITAQGMHPVHRAVFVTGVLAYLSAPLWFLFLAISTGLLAVHTLMEPQYFMEPHQLFPIWPQWHPEKAIALFSATATLLFLPKILSVLLVCLHGAKQYGGVLRVFLSVLCEILFSMLLAPVRMLFHSRFVAAAFLGWSIHWKSPPRNDSETHWSEAIAKHGWHTLLGLGWSIGIYLLNPALLPWILPIVAGLVLSAPLSVLSSRVTLGRWFQRAKLFTIPEELALPTELQATATYYQRTNQAPSFADAVTDPVLNALACAAEMSHPHEGASSVCSPDDVFDDSAVISEKQKNAALDDPLCLSRWHLQAWTSSQYLLDGKMAE
jgi:membrane glycosyltransferase